MFSGLVSDIGTVRAIETADGGSRLRIETPLARDLAPGDSVAVNGACLTAVEVGGETFSAEVMNQTLTVTALGSLEAGARVNLELALRVGDRIGGHLVQGHVDGVGEITAVERDGFSRRLQITIPGPLRRYVVEHGSVTLDGVSLTVAGTTDEGVEVSLIPETLERTTLGDAEPGDGLNVEVDLIARYAERLLGGFDGRSGGRDA